MYDLIFGVVRALFLVAFRFIFLRFDWTTFNWMKWMIDLFEFKMVKCNRQRHIQTD